MAFENVEVRVAAVLVEKTMRAGVVDVKSDDLARIVDAVDNRAVRGSWSVECGVAAVLVKKAVNRTVLLDEVSGDLATVVDAQGHSTVVRACIGIVDGRVG